MTPYEQNVTDTAARFRIRSLAIDHVLPENISLELAQICVDEKAGGFDLGRRAARENTYEGNYDHEGAMQDKQDLGLIKTEQ